MFSKIINWTYFKIDEVNIYLPSFLSRWKKNIYKKTLRYTQDKINKDVNNFIKSGKIWNICKGGSKSLIEDDVLVYGENVRMATCLFHFS